MKKLSGLVISGLFVALFFLAWNQKVAAGLSDPPQPPPAAAADKGYFRFLDGDDEPRDEEFSLIPDFVKHLHTIGFPKIATDSYVEKDYFDTCYNIVKNAKDLKREVIPDHGEDNVGEDDDEPNICLVHESMSGAQLWGMIRPSRGLFSGLLPHFYGKSRVQICILSTAEDLLWDVEDQKTAGHLFGTVLCTFDYDGGALKFLKNDQHTTMQGGIEIMDSVILLPGKGAAILGKGFVIPETREAYNVFRFHCHNLAFKTGFTLPLNVVAQLSGFADEEVFCYDSFEDFENWNKENWSKSSKPLKSPRKGIKLNGDDMRFSSQFFGTDCKKFATRDKHALIIGHVVETEIKTNEHTGQVFVWALIRTAKDMEIDVVFRQTLLESAGSPMPKVGGVLRGHFWLSGVILLDGANECM